MTTRYRSNSAWIDLDTSEITAFFGIRPGCQVNNNLYPANSVLNDRDQRAPPKAPPLRAT